ncbi:unnamed protein product [Heligmosomoides polygyrus]|uniref:Uncharacterized protein n=1 Tax=Heligmosomoides polygyrus TaxID=6339 RepID=A0A183FY94_HELPZ|nr:unnamed protein product [Heligmosomoides polygyrus]
MSTISSSLVRSIVNDEFLRKSFTTPQWPVGISASRLEISLSKFDLVPEAPLLWKKKLARSPQVETWEAEAERVKPLRLSSLGRIDVEGHVRSHQTRTGRGHHVVEASPFVRSGAVIRLSTSPRVGGQVVALLAQAMAWTVYYKIFAAITLALLFEHNNALMPKQYEIWFQPSQKVCERNPYRSFDLHIYEVWHVLYNKTSRRIFDGLMRGNDRYDNLFYPDYNWELFPRLKIPLESPELGLGLYISVRRSTNYKGRNDNPLTNPEQTKGPFRDNRPEPGTGLDFSAIFKGGTLFQQAQFFIKGNRRQPFMTLTGTKCAQTEAWIANEGIYKWDERSNAWTPVYYPPWSTRFYY